MKELNCYVFKRKDIRMMRVIEEKTKHYIDLPAPECSGLLQRQVLLLNASNISGENNPLCGLGDIHYDYYFLFTLESDGRMVPQTEWDGVETGYAVGFDKNNRLLFIDPQTNEIEKSYDPCFNTKEE